MISYLAVAMFSSEPKRSRCCGPTSTTMLIFGCTRSQIWRISPGTYAPISAMKYSMLWFPAMSLLMAMHTPISVL